MLGQKDHIENLLGSDIEAAGFDRGTANATERSNRPDSKTSVTTLRHASAALPTSSAAEAEDGAHGVTRPTSRPRTLNPTQFINRAAVRDFLLAEAKKTRAHKFHRVSEDTLVSINEIVRAACVGHVRRMPSKGKTL